MQLAILEQLLQARRDQRPLVLATRLRDGDQRVVSPSAADALGTHAAEVLQSDKAATYSMDDEDVFLLPVNPPLRLLIVGAVHIAEPLIALAALCGYATTIIDPRQAFARAERFARVQLIT